MGSSERAAQLLEQLRQLQASSWDATTAEPSHDFVGFSEERMAGAYAVLTGHLAAIAAELRKNESLAFQGEEAEHFAALLEALRGAQAAATRLTSRIRSRQDVAG